MFEGFEARDIETEEATIHVRCGGSGPPLLLLHGHPQTHVMWHVIAPSLAEHFTVVAPDLRGYGDSSKPPTTADHEPYSKRAMARDAVALMSTLGFEQFAVAGHDRGGRVAYRLALDHPDRVERLAVLDIIPTSEHFRRADASFALGYWHWFFLAQPCPFPESVIGADPDTFFLNRRGPGSQRVHAPEALREYQRSWNNPATIHAICEDYRAAATYDKTLDESERGTRRIACPLLALWGANNHLDRWYDVLAIWRDWADDVRGRALSCGHFLPEEAPEETLAEFLAFFNG